MELEQEAKRRICESVRAEWTPKLRALISTLYAQKHLSWAEVCDEVEYAIVMKSEILKDRVLQGIDPDGVETGFELGIKGMLQAMADLRKLG